MQGPSITRASYYFSFLFLLFGSMAAGMSGNPSNMPASLTLISTKNEVEESASIVSGSSLASSPERASFAEQDATSEPCKKAMIEKVERKAVQEEEPVPQPQEQRIPLSKEMRNLPGLIDLAIDAGLMRTGYNDNTLKDLLIEFFDDKEIANEDLHTLIPYIDDMISKRSKNIVNGSSLAEYLKVVVHLLNCFIETINTHAVGSGSERIGWDEACKPIKKPQITKQNALNRRKAVKP